MRLSKLSLSLAMVLLLGASGVYAQDANSNVSSNLQEPTNNSAQGQTRVIGVGSQAKAKAEAANKKAAEQGYQEPLVKVYGNKTPTRVGTASEIAEYRRELAKDEARNNPPASSTYTYTDEYGNTVVVQGGQDYDQLLNSIYGNVYVDAMDYYYHQQQGGHRPPPPPPGQGGYPPGQGGYPPGQGGYPPVTPDTPGWPSQGGDGLDGNFEPGYYPPPHGGHRPPPGQGGYPPVTPDTPGWPGQGNGGMTPSVPSTPPGHGNGGMTPSTPSTPPGHGNGGMTPSTPPNQGNGGMSPSTPPKGVIIGSSMSSSSSGITMSKESSMGFDINSGEKQ